MIFLYVKILTIHITTKKITIEYTIALNSKYVKDITNPLSDNSLTFIKS